MVNNGKYETVPLFDDEVYHKRSVMKTVFENGDLVNEDTFEAIRARVKV